MYVAIHHPHPNWHYPVQSWLLPSVVVALTVGNVSNKPVNRGLARFASLSIPFERINLKRKYSGQSESLICCIA
jgi:hypothetical protein